MTLRFLWEASFLISLEKEYKWHVRAHSSSKVGHILFCLIPHSHCVEPRHPWYRFQREVHTRSLIQSSTVKLTTKTNWLIFSCSFLHFNLEGYKHEKILWSLLCVTPITRWIEETDRLLNKFIISTKNNFFFFWPFISPTCRQLQILPWCLDDVLLFNNCMGTDSSNGGF